MSAKYLEIPVNAQAASGTMTNVIPSRNANALVSGTNTELGNAATATNAASGSTYATPPGGGVATSIGGTQPGSGTGMTVTFTQTAGVVDLNTVVVVAAGAGYVIGDTGTISTGDGTATYTIATISNSAAPSKINDAAALFLTGANPVQNNDFVYNADLNIGSVQSIQSDTELTLAQSNFPVGGESYYIRRPSQLNSTGANFTTRKVQIGDIVSNTTRGSATPVVTIINETTLTLTTDIFTSAGGYDDTFEILPLATQVYDSTQSFLTTVTTDDVITNTTDNVSGTILSIVDDFRITTSSAVMFGNTDAYTIYDQSSSSNKMYNIDSIISTDRGGDNFTTLVNLNSMNAAADTITITHSDQGTGRLVSSAIETALVRGAVGINLPEPPGPAVTRVLMPIFGGSQVVVETVVVG